MVPGDRRLEDVPETGLARVITGGPLVELHSGSCGEALERLGEGHAVALHDEAEDVAAQAAAEALPALASGRHDEARGLLPVERAQALEGRARLPERDGLTDHVRDLEPTLHFRSDTDSRAAPPMVIVRCTYRRRGVEVRCFWRT